MIGKLMFRPGQLLQVDRAVQIRVPGMQELVEGYVLKDDSGREYVASIDIKPSPENIIKPNFKR